MSDTAAKSKKRSKAPAKTKKRSKAPAKTKSCRAETNRRNSLKSTGPRTAEGKDKSRHNAVTHGLTARSGLLPGEDADEFAALQQLMIDRFKPANDDELTLVERIVVDIWTSDRAAQAGSRRVAERLRHEPLERTKNEKDEAIELGGRLLWQPAFPLPITRRFQIGELTEPPRSDHAIHPHHPARLCLRLEQTIAGCDWLIDRWRNLRQRLNNNGVWSSSSAFQMVRLMGKLAIDMADDLEVAGVFLASLRLLVAPQNTPDPEPFDWKYALIRMLMTFDTDSDQGDAALATEHCAPFARRLAELPLAKMAPRDDEQARKSLCVLIARELARIGEVREILQAIADADLAEAPARMAFETGDEGEKHRRYVLANERVLNRRFTLLLDARKQSEAGACRPSSPVSSPLSAGALGPFDRPYLVRGGLIDPHELAGPDTTIEPGRPTFSDECDPNTGVLEPWPEEFLTTEIACGDCSQAARYATPDADAEPPVPVGDRETAAPRGDGRAHGDDRPTPPVNRYGGTTCDSESFVRNEATLSVVSSPLSVAGHYESIVNCGAPRNRTATAREPPDGRCRPHSER